MKKENKKLPTELGMVTPEEPKQMVIVIENKKSRSRLLDSIKFGAGFYIGFKLARTVKHIIVNAISKK